MLSIPTKSLTKAFVGNIWVLWLSFCSGWVMFFNSSLKFFKKRVSLFLASNNYFNNNNKTPKWLKILLIIIILLICLYFIYIPLFLIVVYYNLVNSNYRAIISQWDSFMDCYKAINYYGVNLITLSFFVSDFVKLFVLISILISLSGFFLFALYCIIKIIFLGLNYRKSDNLELVKVKKDIFKYIKRLIFSLFVLIMCFIILYVLINFIL